MSDSGCGRGSSSSSLAITEKKPQRSGGCVGIFFQLFDWNRRLAKKKLFSKKLLPAARAKRASKKFGRDDKFPMAKHLLTADENCGGFPNMKSSDCSSASVERTHEMKAPGLVARLMGLESMPSTLRGRSEQASGSEFGVGGENRSAREHGFVVSNDQVLKGQAKMDSRPSKLQRTGLFERKPVTRFRAEAMQAIQLKSMLSHRSRKEQPKLSSPVKSPRMGRNAARLMEAAAKILEPGMQATNRAKCALTYGPSLHLPPRDVVMTECPVLLAPNQSKQPRFSADSVNSYKGESSCKSCGNLLDVVDSRPGFASSASVLSNAFPNEFGKSRIKPSTVFIEHGSNLASRDQEETICHSTEAVFDVGMRSKMNSDTKHHFKLDVEHHWRPNQHVKPQKDVISSGGSKHNTHRQSQDFLVRGRGISRPSSSNLQYDRDPFVSPINGIRDVGLEQSLAGCMRPRMTSKQLGKSKFEDEKNLRNGSGDPSSRARMPTRKKRTVGNKPDVEGMGIGSSTLRKQRETGGSEIFGNIAGLGASPMNKNCDKGECLAPFDLKGGRKGANVVSFTFNSPMKRATEIVIPKKQMDKKKDQLKCRPAGTVLDKRSKSDASEGNSSAQIATKSRGEAIGALLEEKLKELTKDRDDMGTNNALPGRSTAAILEELICALAAERAICQEDEINIPMEYCQEDGASDIVQDHFSDSSSQYERFDTNKKLQFQLLVRKLVLPLGLKRHPMHVLSTGCLTMRVTEKDPADEFSCSNADGSRKSSRSCTRFCLAGESEQPSPGSVLDACFSNESCLSESLDDYSGCKLFPESIECSFDQLERSELDVDFSDSANSFNIGKSRSDKMKSSLIDAYSVYCNVDPAYVEVVGNDLTQAWEVFVNAGLLLGTDARDDDILLEDFLIFPLHKLETIFYSEWTSSTGSVEAKEKVYFRRFLFDCLIEFLSSKYSDIRDCRFKGWTRLPMLMNGGFLTREVCQEIRKWTTLASNAPDEIMEMELNHDLSKWTGFEIESLETGDEIELHLLHVLIDELVVDIDRCVPYSPSLQMESL
ncbi:hypothetical protein Syun_021814 [Stephania yunnanensis]|uniref:DUF4378 domain-containing protein n=1 Tax=Stephania yunnanensis TaxID=152371 RepID=A0AAP0IGP2_9MAGN